MKHTAIVHAGQAHADEFLAVGFACTLGVLSRWAYVYRRDPTEEELENPNVLVLDIGNRHEPEKNNFDHHQRDRNDKPECAFSLFLQHYAPEVYNILYENTRWIHESVMLDTHGPFALADANGLQDASLIFGLAGAIQAPVVKLLENYQGSTYINHGVLDFMRRIAQSHLDYAEKLKEAKGIVEQNYSTIDTNPKGIACIVETENPAFMNVLQKKKEAVENPDDPIAYCLIKDNRGPGLRLFRYNDDPRIDFSKIEKDPKVDFAHKGGFIASTKERVKMNEILDLVEKSLV